MNKTISHTLCAFVLSAGSLLGVMRAASEEQTTPSSVVVSNLPTGCSALARADLSGVPDAPTQITKAAAVIATDAVPAFCRITAYVAAQVSIKLGLPAVWNGKLIELGCGGHCGLLPDDEIFSASCGTELRKGYVCIISDMGHTGTGGDGVWAINNLQASVDWGYRATHVAALAGKAITKIFYQESPAHSYFEGCSTGGRQALQEAQRFPWDFDGIIAGAPPIRLADLYVTFAWGQRAVRNAAGQPILTMEDLKLLTDGALARCDRDDGLRDGIISSPFTCPFRPSKLGCKRNQTSGCLTPEKVMAAEQIYSGPVDSHGMSLFGAGAVPGSEYGGSWNAQYGGNWGIYYLGKDGAPALYASLTESGLRYLFFSPSQPADWTIQNFDFNKDYKRLDVMQSLYDSSNPDLGRFKTAGGKLLIYHGLNDLSILPQWIIRYYEKVERVMGGREQTQSFVRLFSLPGVEHCAGGPGADTVDYLTALEHWVEQGKAPDELTAYHLRTQEGRAAVTFPVPPSDIAFSRPVYPYPLRAQYRGRGDPNDASSFQAVKPR